MFTLPVPYKDLSGKPKNKTLHFNLFETQVFKLFPEFYELVSWRDSIIAEPELRQLSPEEVSGFYTNLETILLAAYGVPSTDGDSFDTSGQYDIKHHAAFNAAMMMFLSDQKLANDFITAMLPEDMMSWLQKADANAAQAVAAAGTDDEKRKMLQLEAELAALKAEQNSSD